MVWFNRIKEFYDKRLWSKAWVWDAVDRRITAAQYEEITNVYYDPNQRPSETDFKE